MGVGQRGQMKVRRGHGLNGWGLSLRGCSFCPEKRTAWKEREEKSSPIRMGDGGGCTEPARVTHTESISALYCKLRNRQEPSVMTGTVHL